MALFGKGGDASCDMVRQTKIAVASSAAQARPARAGTAEKSAWINAGAAKPAFSLKTPGDGQVDPNAGRIPREMNNVLTLHMNGAPHRDVWARICARDGYPSGIQDAQPNALQREFKHRRIVGIIQKAVGPRSGVIIHRATRWHAEAPPAMPAPVLDREAESRVENFENGFAHEQGSNRTRSPGFNKNMFASSTDAASHLSG
jgi:hypothetical protein